MSPEVLRDGERNLGPVAVRVRVGDGDVQVGGWGMQVGDRDEDAFTQPTPTQKPHQHPKQHSLLCLTPIWFYWAFGR